MSEETSISLGGANVAPLLGTTLTSVIAEEQRELMRFPTYAPGDLPGIDSALANDRLDMVATMRRYRKLQNDMERISKALAQEGAELTAIRNAMEARGEVYGENFNIDAEWSGCWERRGE